MPKPALVRSLSTTEAAYVAGLIDGEGTIALTRKHAGENRQLAVSIANNELPILEYVRGVVGVGKITSKRTSQAHHAPGFCYSLANRQALDLLTQVHGYLRSYKRRRSGSF